MVRTPSTMLPLGTAAPNFSLPNVDGKTVSLADLRGKKALLVMFICNHCPFVKHVADELARLGRDYQAKGAAVVAISSNDIVNHPDDSPEKMKDEAKARGYAFPYLYDADQSVAKAYQAACTPDFFVFDADQKLVYRGQLDGSRPGNDVPVNGADLRAALDAVLAGNKPTTEQRASLGCNIKWKAGNEPDYFKS
ncbi:MAG: thioredoxin family protein [Planctomycetales bacterium]|nr:thioredoxin family protein [Planctomycetales bacterium]MBN8626206.1 thioredoxin family protein [Planctomycetota bacterium]